MIFGTMLLAACLLLGRCLGGFLAGQLGVEGDVGGVGFAMITLMLGMVAIRKGGLDGPAFQAGIGYWAAMYIPIVVALAATQNVWGALRGGGVAVAAGVATVVVAWAAVPMLAGQPTAAGKPTGD
jgi:malonate transporter MadL subunit